MHEFSIALGQKAKDKITGFAGVVIARVQYITGCDQYLLQPPCKDGGDRVEPNWFDEQRLEVVKAKTVRLDNSAGTGADKPAPKK